MKLADVRDAIDSYSGKASEVVRQLGFAGIAVAWIFRTGTILPQGLHLPVFLIIVALALDLLQYVAGTVVWSLFNRMKEKQGLSQDRDFEASRSVNLPTYTLFWLKIVAIIAAYTWLGSFVYSRVF